MLKTTEIKLSEKDFQTIRDILYSISGIYLVDSKKELVKTRLLKRMSEINCGSFKDYLERISNDKKELYLMVDILTTNKTDFFREIEHFDFLKKNIFPKYENQKLTIWSAGCSNGKEPYSIAIEINEFFKDTSNKRILATDISLRMIEEAKRGIYEYEDLDGLSKNIIERYFEVSDINKKTYKIKDEIKRLVSFAVLNLLDNWPMKGPFDVIFCRNVMIYFTKEIQENLINRFYDIIKPGGYLFVGHSESLNSIRHNFKYIQPAVYIKEI